MIIFNDNSVQMSVKQIPLYIKEKRKIPDNLGRKENSTHFHHLHSLSVKFPQIFYTPTPQLHTLHISI